MEFIKKYRFGEPFWFSGIYKISQYTWHRGAESEPHYRAYYLVDKNWGDSVIPAEQGHHKADNKYTFEECVHFCEEHAKNYTPSNRQVKQAEIAMNNWVKD